MEEHKKEETPSCFRRKEIDESCLCLVLPTIPFPTEMEMQSSKDSDKHFVPRLQPRKSFHGHDFWFQKSLTSSESIQERKDDIFTPKTFQSFQVISKKRDSSSLIRSFDTTKYKSKQQRNRTRFDEVFIGKGDATDLLPYLPTVPSDMKGIQLLPKKITDEKMTRLFTSEQSNQYFAT